MQTIPMTNRSNFADFIGQNSLFSVRRSTIGQRFLAKTSRFLAEACRYSLTTLANYYSRVLETKVSLRQTLLLLNAQLAFFFTVFPLRCAIVLRLLCLCWLVSALLKCRNCGLRTSD